MKEQHNNKRNNRVITYHDENYTLTQLSEKVGINKTTLKERLNLGWSVEDAVNKPVRLWTKGYRTSSGARMESEG
jgi:lambda repressor-like predicted transcriptional regulator